MNYLNILGFETVPAGVKDRSFYDLKAALPGSKGELDFATLKGKAVLIVNTASKWYVRCSSLFFCFCVVQEQEQERV
jgi:hypothetical protein